MTPVPGRQADRQLPVGDEIFLDHVGHFVHDPEAAGRALIRAGFAPAPVSIQTNPDPEGAPPRLTGTGNVTAMLRRGYVEALFKTADTPLGRELDTAMARYPGLHLAAFAVADAADAHRRLGAEGFRMRPLVEMARPVDTDAGPETAAFSIARVEAGEMPEGRIQILTHRTEPLVWQPRWLSHRNGALGLVSIVIAVADVDEAATRFARFTGRSVRTTVFGRTIALDRGSVELVTADALSQLLPELALPSLPFMAAYEVSVRSLDVVEAIFNQTGLPVRRQDKRVVAAFPAELGCGAWLFSAVGADDPR
jgi:hypothetical protein